MSAPLSTPTDGAPAIRIEGLTRVFPGGIRGLDGIDLFVPAGSLTALLGPKVSGMSTLLRIVAGADRSDTGAIQFPEIAGRPEADHRRGAVGYATQHPALDGELTGMETLRLFHALRGLPAKGRRARLLMHAELFELLPYVDRPVAGYSGGERQRLHLAVETIHAPRLLLLDEPTTSIDPSGRRDLWTRLGSWRDEGSTIVVATHDLSEAETHADYVVILHNGRVAASGSPAELIARHEAAGSVITVGAEPDESTLRAIGHRLESMPDVIGFTLRRKTLTLWRREHPPLREPALDIPPAFGLAVDRFERIEPGLAGVYFRLTGGSVPGGEGRARKQERKGRGMV